jgi:hypothetical protein
VRGGLATTLALVFAVALAGLPGGCGVYEKARQAVKDLDNPYATEQLSEQQEIALIDSMRAKLRAPTRPRASA